MKHDGLFGRYKLPPLKPGKKVGQWTGCFGDQRDPETGQEIVVFDEGWFHRKDIDDHMARMMDLATKPVLRSPCALPSQSHPEDEKIAPEPVVRSLWRVLTDIIDRITRK